MNPEASTVIEEVRQKRELEPASCDQVDNIKKSKLEQPDENDEADSTPFLPEPVKVTFSERMCCSLIKLSEGNLTAACSSGFRTVCSTHSVNFGVYYFEFEIPQQLAPTAHIRVGVCRSSVNLQGPVGFDCFGYGFRDVNGAKIHNGRRYSYAKRFGAGSVLGVLIRLMNKPDSSAPSHGESTCVASNDADIDQVNTISLFIDGEDQGLAFANIPSDSYYAAASLYMGGTVTFNPGPNFRYPPAPRYKVQPLSSAAMENDNTKPIAEVFSELDQCKAPQVDPVLKAIECAKLKAAATAAPAEL